MRHDIRDILAYGCSVLLYPLFVPTYIVGLFCLVYTLGIQPLPVSYCRLATIGTALLTGILPLLILIVLIRLKRVQNLDVSDARERTLPYLLTWICMIVWVIFLRQIHMPHWMIWSGIACCVEVLLVTLINLRWKISVHLSSMGGALAILSVMTINYGLNPLLFIGIPVLLSWLLMLSRIRLEAHTPLQTVCGFLLGLIIVLIPNLIILCVN